MNRGFETALVLMACVLPWLVTWASRQATPRLPPLASNARIGHVHLLEALADEIDVAAAGFEGVAGETADPAVRAHWEGEGNGRRTVAKQLRERAAALAMRPATRRTGPGTTGTG